MRRYPAQDAALQTSVSRCLERRWANSGPRRTHGVTAMMVLSYIPCIQATHPPNEGGETRCGRVGQQTGSKSSLPPCPRIAFGPWRPRKGRPRPFAEDRGLSAEWGERGVGGWGHAHPARDFLNAAAPIQFLPPHL